MDVVLFSRIQFTLTTAFHIVFPILTMALRFSSSSWNGSGSVQEMRFITAGGVSESLPFIFWRLIPFSLWAVALILSAFIGKILQLSGVSRQNIFLGRL